KYGMLGTTFGGNPLACAAALAVLEVMRDERLMGQANETGDFLRDILQQFPSLENIRGRGLMIGVDVINNSNLRRNLLFHQHVFTGEAKPNVIRFLPALNIKASELTLLQNALSAELLEETAINSSAAG
ncbi:MAG: aminotransferase class III-fold pyridoxal phosphate-dependent enzyme, partial [Chitinophagaceae bacterium]